MQQMMHIFRKDVRGLAPQIALAVLLLGGFLWSHAGGRSQPTFGGSTLWILVHEYGGVLVVLGWLALIVRVIMEEPQVGDRHFWLTRPYQWKSLLGAKVLFILVFVNLPLFTAQMLFLAT